MLLILQFLLSLSDGWIELLFVEKRVKTMNSYSMLA